MAAVFAIQSGMRSLVAANDGNQPLAEVHDVIEV